MDTFSAVGCVLSEPRHGLSVNLVTEKRIQNPPTALGDHLSPGWLVFLLRCLVWFGFDWVHTWMDAGIILFLEHQLRLLWSPVALVTGRQSKLRLQRVLSICYSFKRQNKLGSWSNIWKSCEHVEDSLMNPSVLHMLSAMPNLKLLYLIPAYITMWTYIYSWA